MTKSLIQKEDFDLISSKLFDSIDDLKSAKILITGATGFFGCWLLEALNNLNSEFDLSLKILALTRNKSAFRDKYPHFFEFSSIEFIEGDIASLDVKSFSNITHIIHAACDTDAKRIKENPQGVISEGYLGSKNTLEIAKNNPNSKYLFVSSGAIYGKQIDQFVAEDCDSGPDLSRVESCYGESKRIGEVLTNIYHKNFGVDTKIARGFSFVGPYLKMDGHYAIGNFILNSLQKKPIQINSDGSAVRSYLYAADLVVWLLKILIKGHNCYPYNIGSNQTLSILELANNVKLVTESEIEISVLKKSDVYNTSGSNLYVPDINRSKNSLNLEVWTSLEEAIIKTFNWNQNK